MTQTKLDVARQKLRQKLLNSGKTVKAPENSNTTSHFRGEDSIEAYIKVIKAKYEAGEVDKAFQLIATGIKKAKLADDQQLLGLTQSELTEKEKKKYQDTIIHSLNNRNKSIPSTKFDPVLIALSEGRVDSCPTSPETSPIAYHLSLFHPFTMYESVIIAHLGYFIAPVYPSLHELFTKRYAEEQLYMPKRSISLPTPTTRTITPLEFNNLLVSIQKHYINQIVAYEAWPLVLQEQEKITQNLYILALLGEGVGKFTLFKFQNLPVGRVPSARETLFQNIMAIRRIFQANANMGNTDGWGSAILGKYRELAQDPNTVPILFNDRVVALCTSVCMAMRSKKTTEVYREAKAYYQEVRAIVSDPDKVPSDVTKSDVLAYYYLTEAVFLAHIGSVSPESNHVDGVLSVLSSLAQYKLYAPVVHKDYEQWVSAARDRQLPQLDFDFSCLSPFFIQPFREVNLRQLVNNCTDQLEQYNEGIKGKLTRAFKLLRAETLAQELPQTMELLFELYSENIVGFFAIVDLLKAAIVYHSQDKMAYNQLRERFPIVTERVVAQYIATTAATERKAVKKAPVLFPIHPPRKPTMVDQLARNQEIVKQLLADKNHTLDDDFKADDFKEDDPRQPIQSTPSRSSRKAKRKKDKAKEKAATKTNDISSSPPAVEVEISQTPAPYIVTERKEAVVSHNFFPYRAAAPVPTSSPALTPSRDEVFREPAKLISPARICPSFLSEASAESMLQLIKVSPIIFHETVHCYSMFMAGSTVLNILFSECYGVPLNYQSADLDFILRNNDEMMKQLIAANNFICTNDIPGVFSSFRGEYINHKNQPIGCEITINPEQMRVRVENNSKNSIYLSRVKIALNINNQFYYIGLTAQILDDIRHKRFDIELSAPEDLSENYLLARVVKYFNYLVHRSGFTETESVKRVLGKTTNPWLNIYLTNMYANRLRFYKEFARVISWQQEYIHTLIKNNEYEQYGERSLSSCSNVLNAFLMTLLPPSLHQTQHATALRLLLVERIRRNEVPAFDLKSSPIHWLHSVFFPCRTKDLLLNAALKDLNQVLSVCIAGAPRGKDVFFSEATSSSSQAFTAPTPAM